MSKLSQKDLAGKLQAASQKVVVGGLYQHYKGDYYKVLSLGFLEATMELCVAYQAEYGEKITFIRPLKVWLETVEFDGKRVPRFEEV
jgi:hypothetical protein